MIFHEQIGGEAELQNVYCYVFYQKVHYCDHKSPLLYSDPVPPILRKKHNVSNKYRNSDTHALADVFEFVDGA